MRPPIQLRFNLSVWRLVFLYGPGSAKPSFSKLFYDLAACHCSGDHFLCTLYARYSMATEGAPTPKWLGPQARQPSSSQQIMECREARMAEWESLLTHYRPRQWKTVKLGLTCLLVNEEANATA